MLEHNNGCIFPRISEIIDFIMYALASWSIYKRHRKLSIFCAASLIHVAEGVNSPKNGGEKRARRFRSLYHQHPAALSKRAMFNGVCLERAEIAYRKKRWTRRASMIGACFPSIPKMNELLRLGKYLKLEARYGSS